METRKGKLSKKEGRKEARKRSKKKGNKKRNERVAGKERKKVEEGMA